MTLDHVGIATSEPAQIALFERLLGAAPYKTETVESQGVRTVFFGDGGVPGAAPKMEALDATRADSPVAGFVARRGPGLHHLAFEVADVEAEMARVADLGIRLLADTPSPGADGKRIVFLHPKDTAGVLVELVETVRPMPEWVQIPRAGATGSGGAGRSTKSLATSPLPPGGGKGRSGRRSRPAAGATRAGGGAEAGAADAVEPGATLAVQLSGPADAPSLLVLHGALGSTELETDRLVRRWERTFRVHALEFSGHGRSGDLKASPTWRTFVDDAITASEHFGLQGSAVFGFSLGGAVALMLALDRPDAVGRLAVHGANVQWDAAEVEAMTAPMEPARMASEHPFWARRLGEVHGDRWQRLVSQVADFTRGLPDARLDAADLARIQSPTLVSAGDRDRFFDVRHAVGLYRAIPDAHLRILPGVDHPIQTVNVPAFADGVADFLLGDAN